MVTGNGGLKGAHGEIERREIAAEPSSGVICKEGGTKRDPKSAFVLLFQVCPFLGRRMGAKVGQNGLGEQFKRPETTLETY